MSGITKFSNNVTCMNDLYVNGILHSNNQVFSGNSIYDGAITCYSSLNVSGNTTINNNLVITGTTSCEALVLTLIHDLFQ